ncbi:hypothetical protein [Chitiniphilus shinanonensis]|uniref:phage major capsid protein n=1 Tax=Chitiniphilus shinanonensis TaxID=553088 RepID=UPI003046B6B4
MSRPVSIPAGGCAFIEAVDSDQDGRRYLIWVIRAGESRNRIDYPEAVLREAAPLFDNARVFVKSDAEHIKGAGKDLRNLVGGLSEPRFVEATATEPAGIQAMFTVIDPSEPIAIKLREAVKGGLAGLFGFSIDADGRAANQRRGGRSVSVAKSIDRVTSVDLIVEPGAGGGMIRLVEAVQPQSQETTMLREQMLKFIEAKTPIAYARLNPDTATDDEIQVAYREAVIADNAATGQTDTVRLTEAFEERMRMIEIRATARTRISNCNLPPPAKARLQAEFERRERFVEADVDGAIQAERDYLAQFVESGRVSVPFDVQVEDRSRAMGDMLDAFFDPSHAEHRRVQSFRECYVEITGDRDVTGQLRNCDRSRMAESLGVFREALDSTSFALALGDSITHRMLAQYANTSIYDAWRPLVGTPVPINDFRVQHRTRIGGYGDLPVVAEKGDYTALNSPDDEEATYALKKRGGTEQVTLEMVANDDVGTIRQIPAKLSNAAKRSLAKFVLDFLRANPLYSDGKAVFHADHKNLLTAALSAGAYSQARLAMMKQAEQGSNEPLGLHPRFLFVPAELEETAADLFRRDTNLDETFVQSLKPTIVPVWYWTDANDWAVTASPNDAPFVELGFFNGREEPELLIQDAPTVGSMFSNDVITYKIRHIYGGNVVDYRPAVKSVVA